MRYWRRVSLWVLLAAVVGLGSPLAALAQDGGSSPLCSGLSESDCQLILDANTAMDGVDSFSAPAWRVSLAGEKDGESFDLRANGSAQFDLSDGGTPAVHLFIESASVTDQDGSTTFGDIEVILKDKMLYLRVDTDWYGGEMDMSAADEPETWGKLLDQFGVPHQPIPDLPAPSELPDLDMGEFLATARRPDETLMGQSMAVFTTHLDIPHLLGALMLEPSVGTLLIDLLKEQVPMLGLLTARDLPLFAPFIPPLLGETGLDLDQWIGTEDGLIHQVALRAVLDFDPARTPFRIDTGTVGGQFSFTASVDEVGAPFEITPPDSYKPLSELRESGESFTA